MREMIRLRAALALAAIIVFIPFAKSYGAEEKAAAKGMRVVVLKGSPEELGRQQGKLLREEVRGVYKLYLYDLIYNNWVKKIALVRKNKATYKNPAKGVAEYAQGMETHIPAEYVAEMKALAEESGLKYADILNMTAHLDYLSGVFCSTMVAAGKATPDGKLVEARNLDWAEEYSPLLDTYSAILVYHPDKGRSFVSFIYAGIAGALTAVNDAKLTVELNISPVKDTESLRGFPALLIVRHIAQNATTLDEAEAIIKSLPIAAGYNVTVADGKTNTARLFEISPGGVGVMNMSDDGTLVSTNHYTTESMMAKHPGDTQRSTFLSGVRYDRLKELLKELYGNVTPDAAVRMIHDDNVKMLSTVQSAIFKPADNLLWVWRRGFDYDYFEKFDVEELLKIQETGDYSRPLANN